MLTASLPLCSSVQSAVVEVSRGGLSTACPPTDGGWYSVTAGVSMKLNRHYTESVSLVSVPRAGHCLNGAR